MTNELLKQPEIDPATHDDGDDGFMFSDGKELDVVVIDAEHGFGDHSDPSSIDQLTPPGPKDAA